MSNIVEEHRKKLEKSQEEIATHLGISRQHYNAIENNRSKPSVELAKALAEVLGISWTIFFDNEVNT